MAEGKIACFRKGGCRYVAAPLAARRQAYRVVLLSRSMSAFSRRVVPQNLFEQEVVSRSSFGKSLSVTPQERKIFRNGYGYSESACL